MSEMELKPCPFCGEPPYFERTPDGAYAILCLESWDGPVRVSCKADTMEEAAAAWNRRAEPCDRAALLELADEMSEMSCANYGPRDFGFTAARWAQAVRDACKAAE